MWKNKDFDEILSAVLSRRLGDAVTMMENYLLTHTQLPGRDSLAAIRRDYQLMADYWQRGYDDPQRTVLYAKLLQRMYSLAADTLFYQRLQSAYSLQNMYRQSRESQADLSIANIRSELEAYVSESALLELEPAHVRQQKMAALIQDHQHYMRLLFGFLTASPQWSETEGRALEELLLAPTINVQDQQLLISALTLSAMNIFDMTKFRVLLNIYEQATDEHVRQRALVGWVFALNDLMAPLYPEMDEMVARLCQQEKCRQELMELQLQMVYCLSADDDSRKIQNEIIPDLMKGNNIRMTRQGLVEMDEDKLEDILHPEASERNIEKMEASMRKMADMQRRGSDIYFAGFSQMKRFPFFSDLSNWFASFDPHHPGISEIWERAKGRTFLQAITRMGAFCDSDKYSFVLAFDQVISHLPAQMMDMIEKGEAAPMAVGGEVPVDEQKQPAFIRRLYLQNLYRFFRLFPQRSEFCNPFEYPQAIFLDRVEKDMTDGEHMLLLAQLKSNLADVTQEEICRLYRNAKDQLADTSKKKAYERALKDYARAVFRKGDYDESLAAYETLLTIVPENRNYQLNAAICQVKTGAYEKALKVLYRLNYEDENDAFVNSTMAWALTLTGKFEQARRLYDKLLAQERKNAADVMNYGFCLWFQNDIAGAVSCFREFVGMLDDGREVLRDDMTATEHDLLTERGISEVDIQLMLDAVSS